MVLAGSMESLPDEFPPNLINLSLVCNDLKKESDPFVTLQNLKELKYLKLRAKDEVNEINVFSGGFPKLEVLEIASFIGKFNIFSRGFPKLEKLELTAPIKKFNVFSGGFSNLEKLELTTFIETFNVFSGGFPKLEKLELRASLKKFNVFSGGFPKLGVLDVKNSIGEFNVFSERFSKLGIEERKQRGNSRIGQWIDDSRDISYSLEDELETFTLVEKRSDQIGTTIDRLQKEIAWIPRSSSTYEIENLGVTSRRNEPENEKLRRWRQWNASEEDFSFVGLQNDLKTLKERMLDTKEKRRCCFSVMGMGGLGKTTIARKVYKDVKTHFEFSIWVYISKEFNIEDILEKISRDITWCEKEKDEIMKDEIKLRRKIKEFLSGKRYLVVLDDVWDCRLSQNLTTLFPDENNGSRLLLTTRSEEVARYVDPIISPHNLRPLDKDESWELFCQKAFLIPGEDPEDLLKLSKRITEKCGGLPLAIVVLGGLLSQKPKQDHAWKGVLNRINSVLDDSQEQCKAILSMSYEDLPFNMKPCFLYFGLFPEEMDIPAKRLIHFWVAENFVQALSNEKLEDAAEECLEELICRSLVQVAKRKHDGGVKLCRIHDLLRDLAINEAWKDNFLHTRRVPESMAECPVNVRRLSIQSGVVEETEIFKLFTSSLRSVFLMSYIYKGKVEELIPKMQLIRILDMPNFPLVEFPEEINQLIHLRYLGLRFDRSLDTLQNLKYRFPSIFPDCCFEFINPCVDFFGRTRLPPTPSNLKYLQTLNFSDSYAEMSHSIWTLCQLRHLYGKHLSIVGDDGDQRIDGLKNLQTLHLRGGNWINNGLENLWNLRDLRIDGDLGKYHEGLSKALKKLLNLRVLKLSTFDKSKIPQLPSLSHLRDLKKMVLIGPIESLPGIEEFPPNLTNLSLVYNDLKKESDPFATLQNLKDLKYLKLETDEQENEINIFSGGFPKLEVLELGDSSWECESSIGKFNIFSGGFPKLEKLELTTSIKNFNVFSGGFPKLEKLELTAPIEKFNVFSGGFPKLEKLELTASIEKFNVFPRGFPKLEVLEVKVFIGEFNVFSEGFSKLEKLRLDNVELEEWFPSEFNVFSGGFPKLEVLELVTSMAKFNVFSGGFPKLEKLELQSHEGNEIKVFSGGFPKLEVLELEFSEGDKFYVYSGAFPKLEKLTVVAYDEDTLHLEEGSLSRLKRLILSPSSEYIPDALKSMESLQELKISECMDVFFEIFIEKFNVYSKEFVKLEKLEIGMPIEEFNVCSGGFPKLEKLVVTSSITEFNVSSEGFPNLEVMVLEKSIEKFYVSGEGFPKLKKLVLSTSIGEFKVFSGGFPKLEVLELELRTGNKIKVFPNGFPKLEILKLEFSKEDKFYVSSGAFPKLEELTLVAPEEDTLHLKKGSLRRLKRLIMLSPKLKCIPDAVKSMYFLEELKLSDISIELFNRVQQGGEDWHKIQHVSNIYVDPPSDYRFF